MAYQRISRGSHLPGFTIIELIVCITIIGMLFALAGAAISNARLQGRDARRVSDILLIGRGIDQAATLSRGTYPRNAVTIGQDSVMCANEIIKVDSAGTVLSNPASIDITAFPGRKVPTDPVPMVPSLTCTDMQNGYTYHTHYKNSTDNLATEQGVSYSLEVGLERGKANDETQLLAPSQLRGVNTSRYPDQSANRQRLRFVFNGPRCGTLCYGN